MAIHSMKESVTMLNTLDLGIKKVTIPLPFALDHVHCFLTAGENGWTMIDTGLHQDKTAAIWKEAIGEEPLERIILTHLHPDHVGYAGTLQQKTGAHVWMTERDSNDLSKIWESNALPELEKTYQEAAVPKEISQNIIRNLEGFHPYIKPLPEVNHYLQDNEKIVLGGMEYEVYFTPGHAAGLVCFFNHEHGVLLSTDHILPKITPNIAYWFYGEPNPLQSFENSLQRIKQLDAKYVIPSHGEPFENANQRIDEIWLHHEERLARTIEAAKDGVTVFEMCGLLFRKNLSMHDYQFAIGETIAHLEYLVHKNMLLKGKSQGVWVYHYHY